MAGSTFTFPYQYEKDASDPQFTPLINLPVWSKFGWQNMWFLLDSGADITLLTTSIADTFGLVYDKKKLIRLFGIGEHSINAYPGSIKLKHRDKELSVRTYFSTVKESTLLLGRLDVFNKFDITFSISKKQIIFSAV